MTTTQAQYKTIEEAIRDGNSNVNQDIKRKFIEKEVYCNVNTMVNYILSQSFEDRDAPFSHDDITNSYCLPEYIGKYSNFEGGSESDRDEEIERLEKMMEDDISDDEKNAIQEEIDNLRELDAEPSEVFEWWMVSPYLCKRLEEKGGNGN